MNTVIFSDYDSCYSSALLLSDGVEWGLIDRDMYKERIPAYASDIADYDDEKLFAFFKQIFNAEIKRIIIIIDGEVIKVRCKCPRGFFGYEMVDGKVQETE
jgi:hypothetical protein